MNDEDIYYDDEIDDEEKTFDYKNILNMVITFLISTSKLVLGISPFGIAMISANVTNKYPIIYPFIGGAIGVLLSSGLEGLFKFVFTTFVFLILTILIKPKKDSENDFTQSKLAFSVILIEVISMIYLKNVNFTGILNILLNTVAILIFYNICVHGQRIVMNYKEKMIASIEENISAILLIATSLLVFRYINVYSVSVLSIVFLTAVYLFGYRYGSKMGAIVGLIMSGILTLSGVGGWMIILSYVTCGLLCGQFKNKTKLGKILLITLIGLVTLMLSAGLKLNMAIIHIVYELFIASFILLILPKRVELKMEELFDDILLIDEKSTADYSFTTNQVKGLNEAKVSETANVKKIEFVSEKVKQ